MATLAEIISSATEQKETKEEFEFIKACCENQLGRVSKFLKEGPFLANTTSVTGGEWHPLAIAAKGVFIELAKLLVAHGAALNAQSTDRRRINLAYCYCLKKLEQQVKELKTNNKKNRKKTQQYQKPKHHKQTCLQAHGSKSKGNETFYREGATTNIVLGSL